MTGYETMEEVLRREWSRSGVTRTKNGSLVKKVTGVTSKHCPSLRTPIYSKYT